MRANVALILAGGVGSRLGSDIPKQYIQVGGKPIIVYCLERFAANKSIDAIVVAAAMQWIPFVNERIDEFAIDKVVAVIEGGSSRQHSIMKGLQFLKEQNYPDDSNIIIHDAARPCVSGTMIDSLINGLGDADGVMPVLPVKDTMYVSKTGKQIDGLLNRSELYGGQAPEMFCLGKYYEINAALTERELELVRGSSEIAYHNGLVVNLIPGDEGNYKITTQEDLARFAQQISKMGEER